MEKTDKDNGGLDKKLDFLKSLLDLFISIKKQDDAAREITDKMLANREKYAEQIEEVQRSREKKPQEVFKPVTDMLNNKISELFNKFTATVLETIKEKLKDLKRLGGYSTDFINEELTTKLKKIKLSGWEFEFWTYLNHLLSEFNEIIENSSATRVEKGLKLIESMIALDLETVELEIKKNEINTLKVQIANIRQKE